MITGLAFRLVRSRAPLYRWRRFIVPLTAFTSILMLSAVFGVLQMFFREDARLTARSGISSQAWSGSDLWVLIRDDAWANTQFNVVWISPAGNGDAILPPGLDILPSPGAFAV